MYLVTEECGDGINYKVVSRHETLEEAQEAHKKKAIDRNGMLKVNSSGFPPYCIRKITKPTLPNVKKVKKGVLK